MGRKKTAIRCSGSVQKQTELEGTPMDDEHEKYMKRCYELAISAGKKGYDMVKEFVLKYQKELNEMWETEEYKKLPPLD
jgi:hypothetical protein